MQRIVIVASYAGSLSRFRGDLIRNWVSGGNKVVALSPGCFERPEGLDQIIDYIRIPLKRTGLNPFEDLLLWFSLVKILLLNKTDYLFLYTIKPIIFGSLAAVLFPRIKVFSMITGLGYLFTTNKKAVLLKIIGLVLYKLALRRNEKVFFQNRDDSADLIQLGVVGQAKIVHINGSGVNLDYYKVMPLPERNLCFLMIARLLEEKGVREFVEAAETLKRKGLVASFKLIGWALGDNPSAISAALVEEWRNGGVVDVYGQTDDVRPYLAASSVYVLPSYREGTPRTVLEAMAMGRPIITSDAPGCRETVEEGVNGFLVPVRNVDALVEAMEKFIREPELVAIMGAESRRIAEVKYDVHKVNAVINRAMGLAEVSSLKS